MEHRCGLDRSFGGERGGSRLLDLSDEPAGECDADLDAFLLGDTLHSALDDPTEMKGDAIRCLCRFSVQRAADATAHRAAPAPQRWLQ